MSKSLVISIGIVVVLIGAYFVMQKQLLKVYPTTEKLTLAIADSPSYALIHIAQNKGYFKDEGLDVTYKPVPRGINSLTDMLTGGSDLAVAYDTPTVIKIYEGAKLQILSTLHTSTQNVALAARKDKGIATLNDLKGKKIGVSKNSAYEFFLDSYLLSQGIKLSDVTIVDGEFADMATFLKTGKVDAVATGNPYLYDIEKAYPPESILIFQSEIYTEDSLLTANEDTVLNKKEEITRFLKALVKAENFYKTNNQEALNAVVSELPQFSEESIRATWNKFTPTLKLDNVLLTLLNREGQWFKDNGIYTTAVPDFRSVIFTDYLQKVKPEAATIF